MTYEASSGGDRNGGSGVGCKNPKYDENSVYLQGINADLFHNSVVKSICDVLTELNIDYRDVLEKVDIDTQVFDSIEAISFSSLGRLIAWAGEQTRCAHFGLLVGQRTTLASLGLLGTLMRHSETVGDALQAVQTHHDLLNRGAVIEVSIKGSIVIVSYVPYEPDTEGVALHCERAIAALTSVLRSLCSPHWSPEEVLLPRLEPKDTTPYTRFFRAPVRFSQEIAALVFPARVLRRPIEGANPLIRIAAERRIRQLEAVIPSDMTAEVQRLVRSTATQQRTSKIHVAQGLAIAQRTLARRLKAEGTTFRSIANQTRLGMAKQLLADTTMSLTEISAALEFSEPAAFTHAFRRWTGTTPSTWRKEQRAS
ncbi:AraC family transcriptional regulator [Methylobacterium sp. WSM2598]|uniref:AraC family transcriptional regulator n=1 Tax=Methylobacterium sp. WSM2598 TaxID=398261 RepID=UPI0003A18386|nr:AraC family transcriptional regulator [Methylobacterium sp. WSM2598]